LKITMLLNPGRSKGFFTVQRGESASLGGLEVGLVGGVNADRKNRRVTVQFGDVGGGRGGRACPVRRELGSTADGAKTTRVDWAGA